MDRENLKSLNRPSIAEFNSPAEFLRAMLEYRKQQDPRFSVLQETKKLRKVSPALVSLVLKGQRQLTWDRVDEFAILLKLNSTERSFLKSWLELPQSENRFLHKPPAQKNRKTASIHLLQDWLNVYVKDCFENELVQQKPDLVFQLLSSTDMFLLNSIQIPDKTQISISKDYLLNLYPSDMGYATSTNIESNSIKEAKFFNNAVAE